MNGLPLRAGLSALACLLVAPAIAIPSGAAAAGRCGDPASRPWCDTRKSPDERAQLLLAAMTEQERISLLAGDELTGVAGFAGTHTGTSDGIPRLGIPTIYFTDGPVGVRSGPATAMPVPTALAAGFDPKLARLMGATIANEAKLKGNDFVFAPTIETNRIPIAGRTFETFGEDPFLSARLTVPWIRGAQGEGVIATVKHFVPNSQEGTGPRANEARPGNQLQALGVLASEGKRGDINVNVDERTLREIYLPQFEAAIRRADAGSIMCAYNKLGGDWSCENAYLLEQLLRDEWGFTGLTIADYAGAHDTARSLANGLDFEPWPGTTYGPTQVNAALAGGVDTALVDEHVHRYLRTLFAYGALDRPAYAEQAGAIDAQAHAAVARRIEENGITLLRNKDRVLPLAAKQLDSVAVVGPTIDSYATGGGSSQVEPLTFTSPLDSITRRLGSGAEVTAYEGSDPAEAASAAAGKDVAIVIAPDFETEGVDRTCLSLQCPPAYGDLDAVIAAVAAANERTVVVLTTGAPVLTPWRGEVAGLLEAWYPGSAAGPAIASVLFGDVDASGRLPLTFPNAESQLPTAGRPERYPGESNEVQFSEGVFTGYRWYDDQRLRPAYPFGFGRSFTRFAYRDLEVLRSSARGALIRLRVRNVGSRTGYAVPQLYFGLPSPSREVEQPRRALKGFKKLELRAGEARTVRFRLDRRALSYWDDEQDRWRVAPGCYRAYAGAHSRRLPLRERFAIKASC